MPRNVNSKTIDRPAPLWNDMEPHNVLQHEKLRHRAVIEHSLAGLLPKEIAKLLRITEQTVHNTLRQPWAREHVMTEMKKSARDRIAALIEAEVAPAFGRIVDLSKNAVSEQVKANMNAEIVNRYLGKATQPIHTSDGKNLDDCTDEELTEIIRGKG